MTEIADRRAPGTYGGTTAGGEERGIDAASPVVSVADLRVAFPAAGVEAVRGVSFTIGPGECVAIVGESGSGKSVTARSLLGLAGPGAVVTATRLELGGRDARSFRPADWRRLRGRHAGLVLQDALVSLDPLRTVGAEISEALAAHPSLPRGGRTARVLELLEAVGVPEPAVRARQHPHQLSGGLRQRALIASAIAAEPPLVIADEPTTALDVTVQAQILRLLAERRAGGTSLLLISHDLAVVSSIADRVLVMKDGTVVEEGTAGEVLTAPAHPYTRTLLAAVPSAASRGTRLSRPAVPAANAAPPAAGLARP
ncbi:ABC transporter ATP-binding protein, partial [Sphaerisporangium fuscum]